jgi:restriction system protein
MDEFAPGMEHPLVDPSFFGRAAELDWLEQRTRESGRKPLVIYGMGGMGKSSLLALFAASGRDPRRCKVWTLPHHPGQAEAMLAVNTTLLRDEKTPPQVILVDNADDLSPATIIDAAERLTNYKSIRAVVFARRLPIEHELTRGQLLLKPLSVSDSREFIRDGLGPDVPDGVMSDLLLAAEGNPAALTVLSGLLRDRTPEQIRRIARGDLYGEQGLIVPSRALLVAARPRILSATDVLIERLRRAPEGLYQLDPRKFEELVADLMEDMGYEVELTPPSNDGGKDILARKDTPAGKMLCLVEAKRYSDDNPVEVSLVRQLYGTLHDHEATNAMMVTTSRFTRGANLFQQRHEYRLTLRDYGHLIEWIGGYKSGRSGR